MRRTKKKKYQVTLVFNFSLPRRVGKTCANSVEWEMPEKQVQKTHNLNKKAKLNDLCLVVSGRIMWPVIEMWLLYELGYQQEFIFTTQNVPFSQVPMLFRRFKDGLTFSICCFSVDLNFQFAIRTQNSRIIHVFLCVCVYVRVFVCREEISLHKYNNNKCGKRAKKKGDEEESCGFVCVSRLCYAIIIKLLRRTFKCCFLIHYS